MSTQQVASTAGSATAADLSERVADVFRTADVGDIFTDDLFVDGHPPYWRFQLEGLDAFSSWLEGYAGGGIETTVVRSVPTQSGFVAELVGRHRHEGQVFTDRKILLCEVRDGRVCEMTVYCSGDWDEQLRARHAAEAPIFRP